MPIYFGYILIFVYMDSAFKRHLGLEFMVRYTEMLRRVQKRVKGLKIGYLWAVGILGSSDVGMRVFEVNALEPELHRSTVQQKLRRAKSGGFVIQEGRYYKLSDKGREAHNILVEETQAELDAMVDKIVNSAKKRLRQAS